MKKYGSLLLLLIQILSTSFFLFTIYIIYALLDVDEADMMTAIGFVLFQPLFGFILTSSTILVCLVAGLPIRLSSNVKKWWLLNPVYPLLGLAIGILLLFLSFNTNLSETKKVLVDERLIQKQVPNLYLSVAGWFVTAFCLLHLYPKSLLGLLRKKSKV